MTVSLTFTIEKEDFYKEMSNLLGLRGEALQKVVNLFQELQADLTSLEDEPNSDDIIDKIANARRELVLLDLRLHEITQMIRGFTVDAEPEEPQERDAEDNK